MSLKKSCVWNEIYESEGQKKLKEEAEKNIDLIMVCLQNSSIFAVNKGDEADMKVILWKPVILFWLQRPKIALFENLNHDP